MTNIRQNNTNINSSKVAQPLDYGDPNRRIHLKKDMTFMSHDKDHGAVEEVNFDTPGNETLIRTTEQNRLEHERERIKNIANRFPEEYKQMLGEYVLAKQQINPNLEGYDPNDALTDIAKQTIEKYKPILDPIIQNMTNNVYSSYDEFAEYQLKIEKVYNRKIKNKEFLPDCSEAEEIKEVEGTINLIKKLYDINNIALNELEDYDKQIPESLINQYEKLNKKVKELKSYSTSGAYWLYDSLIYEETALNQKLQEINETIKEITGGEYNTYEEFKADLDASREKNTQFNNTIMQLEQQKENYTYINIENKEDYKNYIPKYEVKEIENINPHNENEKTITYIFYDKDGNEYKSNRLYKLKEAEQIQNYKDYILSMIPTENRKNINFDFDYYKMYLFLLDRYGYDVAEQYIEDKTDEINCIIGLANAAKFCESLSTTAGDLTNAISVHFKGIGNGTINSIEGVLAWLSENPEKTTNYYEGIWITQLLSTNKYGYLQKGNFEFGQNIGNALPIIALSAIDPKLGKIYIGLQSGGDTYRKNRWKGVDVGTAMYRGILSGTSKMFLKKIMGGLPYLNKVEGNDIYSYIQNAINEGNSTVIQKIVDSQISGDEITVKGLLKEWAKAAFTSAITNAITGKYSQVISEELTYNINEYIEKADISPETWAKMLTETEFIYEEINEYIDKIDDIEKSFQIGDKESNGIIENILNKIIEKYVTILPTVEFKAGTKIGDISPTEYVTDTLGVTLGAKQATERIKVANSSHPISGQGTVLRPEQRVATMNNDNTSYPTSGQGVVLETKKTDSNPNNSTQI